jgi:hypothetical protein
MNFIRRISDTVLGHFLLRLKRSVDKITAQFGAACFCFKGLDHEGVWSLSRAVGRRGDSCFQFIRELERSCSSHGLSPGIEVSPRYHLDIHLSIRTNGLIAVPPFKAKHRSRATAGNTLTSNRTCAKYGLSDVIIEVARQRDQVFRVQRSARHQHALARAQFDFTQIEMLEPCVIMPLREGTYSPRLMRKRKTTSERYGLPRAAGNVFS